MLHIIFTQLHIIINYDMSHIPAYQPLFPQESGAAHDADVVRARYHPQRVR